jgi:hypothetical protein
MAAAEAHAARVTACGALVKGYSHDTATVQARQEYASCIAKLYPADNPITPDEMVWIKVVVALLLVGFVVGAVRAWRDNPCDRILETVMGGVLGAVLAFCGVLLVSGLWLGVRILLL